jgi:glycyl-tRNA synthetase alpha subunit
MEVSQFTYFQQVGGYRLCNAGLGRTHLRARAPRHVCAGQAIKASHFFNLLNARGVISVAERQAYIGRVRDLTKAVCTAQIEKHRARWQAQFPEWAA